MSSCFQGKMAALIIVTQDFEFLFDFIFYSETVVQLKI